MTKIAINGFGRIGRTFFRAAHKLGLEVVAINDLSDNKTLAHLLKYDSTYGGFEGIIEVEEEALIIDGKRIIILAQKEPEKLPWKKLEIDIVVESTGIFTEYNQAFAHIKAGAKLVIITAPAKGEKAVKTFAYGVNQDQFNPKNDQVISMASCTTNALAPVAQVLATEFGIEKALMTTIHSITMDQMLQDNVHHDLRRARGALQSIVPTTTGATKATALIVPELKDKMNGLSVRVPTPTVSLVDFVAVLKKNVTKEEINEAFIKSVDKQLGALAVTNEPLVSADFKGNPAASIVDLSLTQVVGNNLVKILSWYDNELGYSYRLAEFIKYLSTLFSN